MKTSLLAHLYPYFKGSQEDVATSSLNYIISSDVEINKAFTNIISKTLDISITEKIQYKCQVVGKNKERPDMCGFVDGNEKIICESKFYAALTINQPNEYIKRLIANTGYGLIFICPDVRKKGLWSEIINLISAEFDNCNHLSDYCVMVNDSIRVGIISWNAMLSELENVASTLAVDTIPDIHQLIGYCKQLDSEAFVPFVENSLSIENAINEERYYRVLDALIDALKADPTVKISLAHYKATPQWAGYTRYFKIDDLGVSLEYDTDKWRNPQSFVTPFWVKFENPESSPWHIDDRCEKALLKISEELKDDNFIALRAPCYVSLSEVVSDMKKQFLEYYELFK